MFDDIDSLTHNINFLSTLCGIVASAVVVLLWVTFIDRGPAADRLKAVTQHRDSLESITTKKKNSRRSQIQKISLIKQIVERFKLAQGRSMDELRLKLRRAGYHSRDSMFVFLFAKLACMIGFAATSVFFFLVVKVVDMDPMFLLLAPLLATAAGWMFPDMFLKNMSQKREEVLRKAMPDALDLMVICAEAGLGLDATFDRVSREIAPTCAELAEEMGLTGVELNFLPERHKALRGLSDRVPLPSVTALVNTLIQTEKYGTPLAAALRTLGGEMRNDRMMKAEEKAAALPAIMTIPMILFILPPLFIVLIGPAALKVSAIMHGQG
ncbi:MAG: type II secretion system F family protein [Alphaproteobacteria bacterium]|nr:type II secretion system F family protein [Alphaproteobacteria bacterium]